MTPYVFVGLPVHSQRVFVNHEAKDFKEKLMSAVCMVFNADQELVLGENRTRNVSDARCCAMYIMRKSKFMKWTHIATYFHKNHSTVIASVEKCESLIKYNKVFSSKFNKVLDAVNN